MENIIANNIANIDLVRIEKFIINLKIENINMEKVKKMRKKTKKKKPINNKICRSVLFISDSSGDEGNH